MKSFWKSLIRFPKINRFCLVRTLEFKRNKQVFLDDRYKQSPHLPTEGLNILKRVISSFPENVILVHYLAYLNALLLFVGSYRRQIEMILVVSVKILEI